MSQTRQPLPDLVRAFALFGIAVVNVDFFAHASFGGVIDTGWDSPTDRILWGTVATVFLLKSYSLFSLMFGVGVHQQILASDPLKANFAGRYSRRLLGLLLLGFLNITLLFYGDILVVYSLLGTLLLLFRNFEGAKLRRWAIGIYLLQITLAVLIAASTWLLSLVDAEAALRESNAAAAADAAKRLAGFSDPHFLTVAATRLDAWTADFAYMIALQGAGALAFMLYGLYLARSGLLLDTNSPRWSRARRVDLPIGLILAAAGGWLMLGSSSELDPPFMTGFALITLGSPFSTMGYLGLMAAWTQRPDSPLRTGLIRAGGASLTAYLMQGLLMSLIFSGYGLGAIGKLNAASYIPIAVAVALVSLVFCAEWRRRYRLGPVESVLRRWVYLGKDGT